MLQHPILAIDHGDSRIGLACTDPIGIAVHPLATIPRTTGIEDTLSYIKSKGFVEIVVGLPLLKDGSEGDSATKARAFIKELTSHLPNMKVTYVDERYSTVEASAKLHNAGIQMKKQKGIIDQAAAMEILHRYLELNDEGFNELHPDMPDNFPR